MIADGLSWGTDYLRKRHIVCAAMWRRPAERDEATDLEIESLSPKTFQRSKKSPISCFEAGYHVRNRTFLLSQLG
jgi:hypothetical protein